MKRYLLLGSRIALGVYVPAISIKKQLEKIGHSADIMCLEDLYSDRDAVIEETKRSFHEDFRLAKMSYRMPTRNKGAIDSAKSESLKEKLAGEMYDGVIVFSGFWTEFLNELMESCEHYRDRIYAVHMDAGFSLSWKGADHSGIKNLWLYSMEEGRALSILEKPAYSDDRINAIAGTQKDNKRILVHGGGWGIGEYSEKIKTLNELGYSLDIIIYYPDELDKDDKINDYYLLDPEWKPDENRKEYPRLLVYGDDKWTEFGDNRGDLNPIRILMQRDAAVLSKPGGGTLSDSLITATPLIFGEELAKYESDNKKLWLAKKYAVEYSDFAEASNREEMLDEMVNNLKAACNEVPHVLDYILEDI